MRNADEIDWARRYGKRSTLNRFLSKFDHDPSGCWLWNGYTHPKNGYGMFRALGPRQQAHRVMFELYYGLIPEGLELDHLCRNRACVNPEHLEPVSHLENFHRGMASTSKRWNQTHCKRGHPLSGENLYVRNGCRNCRACAHLHQQRYRARLAEAKRPIAPLLGPGES